MLGHVTSIFMTLLSNYLFADSVKVNEAHQTQTRFYNIAKFGVNLTVGTLESRIRS